MTKQERISSLEVCCSERQVSIDALKEEAESRRRNLNLLLSPTKKSMRNTVFEVQETQNVNDKVLSDRVNKIKVVMHQLQNLVVARTELEECRAIVDDMKVRTTSKRINFEADWGRYTAFLEKNVQNQKDLVQFRNVINTLEHERRYLTICLLNSLKTYSDILKPFAIFFRLSPY